MLLNLIVIQPDRTKGVAIDEFTVGIRIYITRFLSFEQKNTRPDIEPVLWIESQGDQANMSFKNKNIKESGS